MSKRIPAPIPANAKEKTGPERVPHLYRAIVREIRRHIRQRGWTMQECDDKSGLNDGYVAKALAPETPSGRVAQYQTLDLLVEALAGAGYRVLIVPADHDRGSRRTLVGALSEQEGVEAERVARMIDRVANGNKRLPAAARR